MSPARTARGPSRPSAYGLLALLAALALAACGGDDAEDTTTAPAQPEPAEQAGEKRGEGADDGAEDADEGGGGRKGEDRRKQRLIGAEEEVRAAIEGFFTSDDPALVCERLATERLLKDAYGGRQGCVQARRQPGSAASSVELGDLFVGGARASALVVPEGGAQDGTEVGVELVQQGGAWRLDSLVADVPAGP